MSRTAAALVFAAVGTVTGVATSSPTAPALAGNAARAAVYGDAALTALRGPLAAAAAPRTIAARQVDVAASDPCAEVDLATSLHCTELVPTPDLRQVRARLALIAPASPFGVAVTVDGRPRVRVTAIVEGLPDPASLVPDARVYVAWLTSLTLDDEVRLGELRNGRTELGEIDRLQYRVIVSAEATPDAPVRRGRLVLRATSPSARLLVHRDLLSPAMPGMRRDPPPASAATPAAATSTRPAASTPVQPPSSAASSPRTQAAVTPDTAAAHAHHAVPPANTGSAAGAPVWTMPPMSGLPMMPGMAGLTPSVAPWLPSPGVGRTIETLPLARPREVHQLRDGDRLTLEAAPVRRTIGGRTFVMYGFNGQYPGPLIQVPQGATIDVTFRNGLEMPSAVHWHGVRLDNAYDGTPGVTQEPVAPGATFTYRVRFPDAGLYWYHPHVREDLQQDLGLAGNMVVAPTARDYYGPANRDVVWMLDDLLVGDDGALVPYGRDQPTHALMGRFGNVFLVNGEPGRQLPVRRGEVARFFFTNVSNARLYNLSFARTGSPSTAPPMKVIASDVGKFEHEAWVTSIVLAPAERAIVDVLFNEPGTYTLINKVQSLNHMSGNIFAEAHPLASVIVDRETVPRGEDHAAAFRTLRRNVDVTTDIDRYRPQFARPVDRTVMLTLRTRDLPAAVANMLLGPTVPLDWNDGMPMENWLVTGREAAWLLREPATGRENMDIAWTFTQGEVIKLRLINDPASSHPMAHPIHVHGQRVLVLARNGVAQQNLVWKDTLVVAAGETVDVLLELSNPGRWMLHCHIAEHLGTGMMLVFEVEPGRARPRRRRHLE